MWLCLHYNKWEEWVKGRIDRVSYERETKIVQNHEKESGGGIFIEIRCIFVYSCKKGEGKAETNLSYLLQIVTNIEGRQVDRQAKYNAK